MDDILRQAIVMRIAYYQLKYNLDKPKFQTEVVNKKKAKKKVLKFPKLTKKWFVSTYNTFSQDDIIEFEKMGIDTRLSPSAIYSKYLVKKKTTNTFNQRFYSYVFEIYSVQDNMRDIVYPDIEI